MTVFHPTRSLVWAASKVGCGAYHPRRCGSDYSRESGMQRRTFIALLSGAAFARPRATHAQQAAPPRHIGFLLVGESPDGKAAQQFREGLRQAGYTEGRDVVIDWRYAQGDYGRVPELTADLIRNRVDVIVQDSTIGTEVAKRATSTIPIVMALVLDPVGSGLVESLAHPGGNVTGLSMMTDLGLDAKRVQLLKELDPQLTRVAVVEPGPSLSWQGGRRPQNHGAQAAH